MCNLSEKHLPNVRPDTSPSYDPFVEKEPLYSTGDIKKRGFS